MTGLTGNGSGGLDATMLVQPSTGWGYNGGYPVAMPYYSGGFGGNGIFGGDIGSLFALFFIAMMFGGFGGGWGMGGFGGGYEFPWLLAANANNQNATQNGFNQAAIAGQLDGIRGDVNRGFSDTQLGIAGLGRDICQTGNTIVQGMNAGFTGLQMGMNSGFANAETAANARQMANMQQQFAGQTATMQGFNGVERGIADLRYTEATEACATRNQAQENTRAIIENNNQKYQMVMDKLCQLELDGVKSQYEQAQREIIGLQNQVNMATMRESQTAQTAQILAGQAAEIDGVYNRLKNCPVPSMPVYGNTPIFTCPQNAYSGCGCNGGNFQ